MVKLLEMSFSYFRHSFQILLISQSTSTLNFKLKWNFLVLINSFELYVNKEGEQDLDFSFKCFYMNTINKHTFQISIIFLKPLFKSVTVMQ